MRVSTLPRMERTSRSCPERAQLRAAAQAARPDDGPGGSSARARASRATTQSRTSSRALTAPTTTPSESSVGRSLSECTARSITPSPSARSSSAVKRPLPPISGSGSPLACVRSPAVEITFVSQSRSGRAAVSSPMTDSVCTRASAEARVPRTTAAGRGGGSPIARRRDAEQVAYRIGDLVRVPGASALAGAHRRIVQEPLHERPRQMLHARDDRRVDVAEVVERACRPPARGSTPPACEARRGAAPLRARGTDARRPATSSSTTASTPGTSRSRAAIAPSRPARRSSTSKSLAPATSPASRSTSAGTARSTRTSGRSSRRAIAARTTAVCTTGVSDDVAVMATSADGQRARRARRARAPRRRSAWRSRRRAPSCGSRRRGRRSLDLRPPSASASRSVPPRRPARACRGGRPVPSPRAQVPWSSRSPGSRRSPSPSGRAVRPRSPSGTGASTPVRRCLPPPRTRTPRRPGRGSRPRRGRASRVPLQRGSGGGRRPRRSGRTGGRPGARAERRGRTTARRRARRAHPRHRT